MYFQLCIHIADDVCSREVEVKNGELHLFSEVSAPSTPARLNRKSRSELLLLYRMMTSCLWHTAPPNSWKIYCTSGCAPEVSPLVDKQSNYRVQTKYCTVHCGPDVF